MEVAQLYGAAFRQHNIEPSIPVEIDRDGTSLLAKVLGGKGGLSKVLEAESSGIRLDPDYREPEIETFSSLGNPVNSTRVTVPPGQRTSNCFFDFLFDGNKTGIGLSCDQ